MKKYSLLFLLVFCICMLTACSDQVSSPQNISAVITDHQTIELTWEAADDAEYYRIYRKSAQAADYKYVCDVAKCQYDDGSVEKGETYIYKVQSLVKNGMSDFAQSEEVTVPNVQSDRQSVIGVPEIESVTLLNDGTAVICIAGSETDAIYEVSRAWSENGEYTVLGTTAYSSFCDTEANSQTAYYQVKAIVDGHYSDSSVPAATGKNAKSVFGIPVLMYHEFLTPQEVKNGINFDEYAIWKDDFEKDLIWLRDNNYIAVTTEQLISYINGEEAAPEKAVILTIDDGKYGVYQNAYPLLKKYNMKAVLSVIGDRISEATEDPEIRSDPTAPFCTWSEIKEMADSGYIEVISHSYSLHAYNHDGRFGANCAEAETADHFAQYAIADYIKMQTAFENQLGRQLHAMAYPYSIRSIAADEGWMKCGYQILYSGNSEADRKTEINYFAAGAGLNTSVGVIRRVARMHGTPASEYLSSMQ